MMILRIKDAWAILRGRARCDYRENKNVWVRELESMMETVEGVKNDLLAAKELAQRAIGKLNILDEKIRVLRGKVSDGLGVTQENIDELGALSQGVLDALTQVGSEVAEADSLTGEESPVVDPAPNDEMITDPVDGEHVSEEPKV